MKNYAIPYLQEEEKPQSLLSPKAGPHPDAQSLVDLFLYINIISSNILGSKINAYIIVKVYIYTYIYHHIYLQVIILFMYIYNTYKLYIYYGVI